MKHSKFLLVTAITTATCAQAAAQLGGTQPVSVSPSQLELQVQQAWQTELVRSDTPTTGCFHAKYPSMIWESVPCNALPRRNHRLPVGKMTTQGAAGRTAPPDAVGATQGPVSYALRGHGLISEAAGSFPTVTGLKTVNSDSSPDEYSVQLNTNYDGTTSACQNHSGCTVWEQFLYGNDGPANSAYVLIEYWMINFGSTCPPGWSSDGDTSCWRQSKAVPTPHYPIGQLPNFRLTAKAAANGNDTVIFTNGTDAYSVSAKGNILNISSVWTQADFNVDGSNSGKKAYFNTGTSITTKLAVKDGTTLSPTCISDGGTTAEINNLILGACAVSAGVMPSIEFTGKL